MDNQQGQNEAACGGSALTAVLGTPVTERDDFLAGVCVALQVVTAADCGVTWADIVRAVGEDNIIQYAANVEPEEWELAGFRKYARNELRRGKPRRVTNFQVQRPAESGFDAT